MATVARQEHAVRSWVEESLGARGLCAGAWPKGGDGWEKLRATP